MNKLHEDKKIFEFIISHVSERTNIREDILEKDYYVCLFLEDLSRKQKDGLQAYFKGGTALYKALKTINRFSEDIDISVNTEGLNRTQNEKKLAEATKKYDILDRDVSKGRSNRSEVLSIFSYDSLFESEDKPKIRGIGEI